MIVELYNATKPASAPRALISSLLLLALACVLAAIMSWTRAGEPLSVRIEPTGWPISFRPPKGFTPGDLVGTPLGELIPLRGMTTGGSRARLVILKLDPDMADHPAPLSTELALGYAFKEPLDDLASLPAPERAPLGPFDGMETLVEPLSTVARVASPGAGVGYAVALSVNGEPIDEDLLRLFDLTCRSIKPVDP
jgi:hypothetical protein